MQNFTLLTLLFSLGVSVAVSLGWANKPTRSRRATAPKVTLAAINQKIHHQQQQAHLLLKEKGSQSVKTALQQAQMRIQALEATAQTPQKKLKTLFRPKTSAKKQPTAARFFYEGASSEAVVDPALGHAASSSDKNGLYTTFYTAFVRNTQEVVAGKAITFVLRESIPPLDLPKGIILRGVPKLAGSRILLEVSSYVLGKAIKNTRLLVFDKEDCQPGLYHDEILKKVEEQSEDTLVDAALDSIDFKGKKLLAKGSQIAKKKRTIQLMAGKEVFIRIPRPEKKKKKHNETQL